MKNNKDRYWDCLDQAMEASYGGRVEEALAWLDEALRANPAGAEAHNGRGEILWDEGRVEEALYEFEHPRLKVSGHGTGCTLAAAIAANLALKKSLSDACEAAGDYVYAALKAAYTPGTSKLSVLKHFSA